MLLSDLPLSKSSRHAKITGDFGETLALYWLSKHGCECALVDHTGIDIIARLPGSDEVLGVSVKSRSRSPGTERDAMNINVGDFEKVEAACAAFRCTPYFAIVVDTQRLVQLFLLPMRRLQEVAPPGERVSCWKMHEAAVAAYRADPEITVIEFSVPL